MLPIVVANEFNKLNHFNTGYVDTELAQDGLPFSILSYANGPGFKEHLEAHDGKVYRVDLSEWDDYTTFETHQPTSAPMKKESHSGTDVAIFAKGKLLFGPMSLRQPKSHFVNGNEKNM
jgi:Alkaline phosphatase